MSPERKELLYCGKFWNGLPCHLAPARTSPARAHCYPINKVHKSFNQVPCRSRSGEQLTKHTRGPPLLLLEKSPSFFQAGPNVNSLSETYLDPQRTISYANPVFSKDFALSTIIIHVQVQDVQPAEDMVSFRARAAAPDAMLCHLPRECCPDATTVTFDLTSWVPLIGCSGL